MSMDDLDPRELKWLRDSAKQEVALYGGASIIYFAGACFLAWKAWRAWKDLRTLPDLPRL